MKRFWAVLFIAVLVLGSICVAVADDPDEIPGTTEMPLAGLRFTPPEAYRNARGTIVTDGAIQLGDGIYYAYWLYCAMTEEELNALLASPDGAFSEKVTELFYVFSIGNGMDFDALNSMLSSPLPTEYVREIGRVGDYSFYLYSEGIRQEFADSVDTAYAEEYRTLAALTDPVDAAFTCYEPVNPNASLIGSKVEFTTTDLDGNPVSSADLFAQHEITMVNIWATWCGPCVGELAELQQIHLRLLEKDCCVVGLLDDTKLDEARRLVSQNGVTYPVILAPDNLYSVFPIEAYPSTFFVNRDGTIAAAPVVGAYVQKYENVVESLLQSTRTTYP